MDKRGKLRNISKVLYLMLIIVALFNMFYSFTDKKNVKSKLFIFSVVIFIAVCGIFAIYVYAHKRNAQEEKNQERRLEEYKEKVRQLSLSLSEIKQEYVSLNKEKKGLEDRNRELLNSVGEYFTLQQVSEAIISILNIKELLKYVNDVIIGVMGVSHSTVVFYDEKKRRLKVGITSVTESSELAVLIDNVNNPVLLETLENNKTIVDNNVDPDKYSFTRDRNIKSLICVPINAKSRRFGLVVAEQKFLNAFNENNERVLGIIGQQVGFAMENAELYQKMQELATIDGLTGIYNRLFFHDRLQKEFGDAQAGGYDLSLVIFDIDHFKKFNDTYGHLFGDKVLKSIVDLVKGCIRSTDIFARFGGEEFIILFPRTRLKEAYEKAELLRDKVSKASIKDELISVSVTVSFGVSSFPECASNENQLVRFADDALYKAKNSGRNCVRTCKVLTE